MPARRGGDHDRALLFEPERRQRLGLGLRHHRLLDGLALAVEPFELGGDARGLRRIVGQQQPRAEVGAPDASAGIDARPEQEAEVPGLGRSGEARGIHQRGQSDVVAPAHGDQALDDEGAIEARERNHVGDRAERDEIEQAEEIGLRPRRAPEAAPAQFAVDRDDNQETSPTAARCPSFERSSSRLGLTTSAGGSTSSAWW